MTQDPINLLQQMQQQSLATAPGLPDEIQAVEMWTGVGFRVGDIHLVTPLDHVTEVIQYPSLITHVPGAKRWVKGATNVRGNIVPIIDLSDFYSKEPIFIDSRVRLVIIDLEGIECGLLVNEVFGLRHFDEEQEKQKVTGIDDPVMAQVQMAFLRDNVLWGVYDMYTLIQNESFRHVHA
ncbi:MAG: chemotaxis protein CheW [Gammaproteobacteria bacterium]|nr:chemotaxis protein CheW [Gammaproteobacteria bacterium]